ncbi:MAG: GNAT family N-acetyltransferase [Rhodobacteraceae bacterium]|nr:GNAT family N-acetyltransferase [Paracoccaceae bacterium]
MTVLRAATAADAPGIAAIVNDVITGSLATFTDLVRTDADIATDIAARGAGYLVAEADGAILGYATSAPFRAGPGYALTHEHSIGIAAGARGQGVGRALLLALQAHLAGQGIHVLVAAISGANPRAVAFHAALGFEPVGRMPQVGRKRGQWLDLVLMQKFL